MANRRRRYLLFRLALARAGGRTTSTAPPCARRSHSSPCPRSGPYLLPTPAGTPGAPPPRRRPRCEIQPSTRRRPRSSHRAPPPTEAALLRTGASLAAASVLRPTAVSTSSHRSPPTPRVPTAYGSVAELRLWGHIWSPRRLELCRSWWLWPCSASSVGSSAWVGADGDSGPTQS
jgi:hypothetical protein